jgi:hypothetical protein
MRPAFFLCSLLGIVVPAGLAASENRALPAPATLEVPGYELRTLDLQKRVLFRLGPSQVEVAVPVFLLCPTATTAAAAQRLRAAVADLLRLTAKPEWTADELRQVIAGLDEAARGLEPPARSAGPGEK